MIVLTLGFLHSRTNLSPFTKDFRGEDHYDVSNHFSQVLLRRDRCLLNKTVFKTKFSESCRRVFVVCNSDDEP